MYNIIGGETEIMDELIKGLSQQASKLLKKDKRLMPVAFLIQSNQVLTVVGLNYETDEKKYDSCFQIGITAKKLKADRIILINDSAARVFTNKKESEYAMKNYSHESPLCYPESMRLDGILLIDLKIESEKSEIYFLRYEKRGEDFHFHDLTALRELIKCPADEGVFSGTLTENVLKGYNNF